MKLTESSELQQFIITTTADRRLNLVSNDGRTVLQSWTNIQDSPILSYAFVAHRYILCTSMSGSLVAFDLWHNQRVVERKDHNKYAVKLVVHNMENGDILIATAGWDKTVFLYLLKFNSDGHLLLDQPTARVNLSTNPEDILFASDLGSRLFLVLTRRDSTFLHYYAIEPPCLTQIDERNPHDLDLDGKQNLAPHSDTWVTFTPSALAICPRDPGVIAAATTAIPHMKLIIARLLFPDTACGPYPGRMSDQGHAPPTFQPAGRQESHLTAVAQRRAVTERQNHEEAAILIHCISFAPQTTYSTPALAWRPDGTGVFVNSDDGVIRGIEAGTGRVISNLKGHAEGSKIRCIWAGKILAAGSSEEGNQHEALLSGGFDQKLLLWRATTCTLPVQ